MRTRIGPGTTRTICLGRSRLIMSNTKNTPRVWRKKWRRRRTKKHPRKNKIDITIWVAHASRVFGFGVAPKQAFDRVFTPHVVMRFEKFATPKALVVARHARRVC